MDRKAFLLIIATLLLLACALIFAAAVKAQEPITYAPVIQPGYFVQQPAVWIPPRPVYVWTARPRYTWLGQSLLGPRWVLAPLVQPVQLQPQPQPAKP